MSCVKCQSAILCQADNVGYSCGHCYHISCILKTKLSIYKPTCPACNKGALISTRPEEKKRGPQLIHYLIALILISLTVSYFLF